MAELDAVAVVLEFVEQINSGDAEKVAALMSEDHEFVDGLGNRVVGREKMRAGWRGYYQMVPDYKISHEEIFAKGNVVAVFGTARGTYVAAGGSMKKKFVGSSGGVESGGAERTDRGVAGVCG